MIHNSPSKFASLIPLPSNISPMVPKRINWNTPKPNEFVTKASAHTIFVSAPPKLEDIRRLVFYDKCASINFKSILFIQRRFRFIKQINSLDKLICLLQAFDLYTEFKLFRAIKIYQKLQSRQRKFYILTTFIHWQEASKMERYIKYLDWLSTFTRNKKIFFLMYNIYRERLSMYHQAIAHYRNRLRGNQQNIIDFMRTYNQYQKIYRNMIEKEYVLDGNLELKVYDMFLPYIQLQQPKSLSILFIRQLAQNQEMQLYLRHQMDVWTLLKPSFSLWQNEFKIHGKDYAERIKQHKQFLIYYIIRWKDAAHNRHVCLKRAFKLWRAYITKKIGIEKLKNRTVDQFYNFIKYRNSFEKFRIYARTKKIMQAQTICLLYNQQPVLKFIIISMIHVSNSTSFYDEATKIYFRRTMINWTPYLKDRILEYIGDETSSHYLVPRSNLQFDHYYDEFLLKYKFIINLKTLWYRRKAFLRQAQYAYSIQQICRVRACFEQWKLYCNCTKKMPPEQKFNFLMNENVIHPQIKLSINAGVIQFLPQVLMFSKFGLQQGKFVQMNSVQSPIFQKFSRIINSMNLDQLEHMFDQIYHKNFVQSEYYYFCYSLCCQLSELSDKQQERNSKYDLQLDSNFQQRVTNLRFFYKQLNLFDTLQFFNYLDQTSPSMYLSTDSLFLPFTRSINLLTNSKLPIFCNLVDYKQYKNISVRPKIKYFSLHNMVIPHLPHMLKQFYYKFPNQLLNDITFMQQEDNSFATRQQVYWENKKDQISQSNYQLSCIYNYFCSAIKTFNAGRQDFEKDQFIYHNYYARTIQSVNLTDIEIKHLHNELYNAKLMALISIGGLQALEQRFAILKPMYGNHIIKCIDLVFKQLVQYYLQPDCDLDKSYKTLIDYRQMQHFSATEMICDNCVAPDSIVIPIITQFIHSDQQIQIVQKSQMKKNILEQVNQMAALLNKTIKMKKAIVTQNDISLIIDQPRIKRENDELNDNMTSQQKDQKHSESNNQQQSSNQYVRQRYLKDQSKKSKNFQSERSLLLQHLAGQSLDETVILLKDTQNLLNNNNNIDADADNLINAANRTQKSGNLDFNTYIKGIKENSSTISGKLQDHSGKQEESDIMEQQQTPNFQIADHGLQVIGQSKTKIYQKLNNSPQQVQNITQGASRIAQVSQSQHSHDEIDVSSKKQPITQKISRYTIKNRDQEVNTNLDHYSSDFEVIMNDFQKKMIILSKLASKENKFSQDELIAFQEELRQLDETSTLPEIQLLDSQHQIRNNNGSEGNTSSFTKQKSSYSYKKKQNDISANDSLKQLKIKNEQRIRTRLRATIQNQLSSQVVTQQLDVRGKTFIIKRDDGQVVIPNDLIFVDSKAIMGGNQQNAYLIYDAKGNLIGQVNQDRIGNKNTISDAQSSFVEELIVIQEVQLVRDQFVFEQLQKMDLSLFSEHDRNDIMLNVIPNRFKNKVTAIDQTGNYLQLLPFVDNDDEYEVDDLWFMSDAQANDYLSVVSKRLMNQTIQSDNEFISQQAQYNPFVQSLLRLNFHFSNYEKVRLLKPQELSDQQKMQLNTFQGSQLFHKIKHNMQNQTVLNKLKLYYKLSEIMPTIQLMTKQNLAKLTKFFDGQHIGQLTQMYLQQLAVDQATTSSQLKRSKINQIAQKIVNNLEFEDLGTRLQSCLMIICAYQNKLIDMNKYESLIQELKEQEAKEQNDEQEEDIFIYNAVAEDALKITLNYLFDVMEHDQLALETEDHEFFIHRMIKTGVLKNKRKQSLQSQSHDNDVTFQIFQQIDALKMDMKWRQLKDDKDLVKQKQYQQYREQIRSKTKLVPNILISDYDSNILEYSNYNTEQPFDIDSNLTMNTSVKHQKLSCTKTKKPIRSKLIRQRSRSKSRQERGMSRGMIIQYQDDEQVIQEVIPKLELYNLMQSEVKLKSQQLSQSLQINTRFEPEQQIVHYKNKNKSFISIIQKIFSSYNDQEDCSNDENNCFSVHEDYPILQVSRMKQRLVTAGKIDFSDCLLVKSIDHFKDTVSNFPQQQEGLCVKKSFSSSNLMDSLTVQTMSKQQITKQFSHKPLPIIQSDYPNALRGRTFNKRHILHQLNLNELRYQSKNQTLKNVDHQVTLIISKPFNPASSLLSISQQVKQDNQNDVEDI